MHLNNIKSILLQDAETLYKSYNVEYSQFQKDSLLLFTRHFAFTLHINGEYITDEDYFCGLDAGIFKVGEKDPWISPVIQFVFDKYVKPKSPKIAELIISKLENDLK